MHRLTEFNDDHGKLDRKVKRPFSSRKRGIYQRVHQKTGLLAD
jgi:hypothetical protein